LRRHPPERPTKLILLSEQALRLATFGLLATIGCCAIGFYTLQNKLGVIGGKIAFPKLVWLGYSIVIWIGLPLLIVLDPRLTLSLRYIFGFLFLSMAVRGVLELWMLYGPKNWSPLYGIAHDWFCMLGIFLFTALAWQAGETQPSFLSITLTIHAVVSMLLFIPEIYFAKYMHQYFHTKGGDAIYFVPDEPKHKLVLQITAAVDLFLTVYIPIFIFSWLYA
jgi:hypothetical protein